MKSRFLLTLLLLPGLPLTASAQGPHAARDRLDGSGGPLPYTSGLQNKHFSYEMLPIPDDVLGTPPPWDVNDHREVVGQGRDSTLTSKWIGLLWRPGEAVVRFEVPGASCTNPFGIDNAGNIVGYYTASPCNAPGTRSGFLRAPDGTFTLPIDVPFPGAQGTEIWDINSAGEMVGTFLDAASTYQSFFRDSSGVYSVISPPGSTSSQAHRISDAGRIGGQAAYGTPCSSGWLLDTSGYTVLNHPTAPWTNVQGISDARNEAVGMEISNQGPGCNNGTGPVPRVYLRRAGKYATLTPPFGASWMSVLGMNETGDIVGSLHGTVAGNPPGAYLGRRVGAVVTR